MTEKVLTKQNELHPNMLMDVIITNLDKDESHTFLDSENETAFLLLTGNATIKWNEKSVVAKRSSLFDELPYCLHVPKGVSVAVTANDETQFLVQKTVNAKGFEPVLYSPENLKEGILGGEQYQGAARRIIRDIFLYDNAPYSNMVLGEIVHYPGRWSSWPPHSHEQPEVYYYRFDRPQGFGVSMIGEDAFIVKDGDISAIPGGVTHPQVTAPGYAMYYTWMIRHFDGNPWNSRDYDPAHEWMLDPEADIWDKK